MEVSAHCVVMSPNSPGFSEVSLSCSCCPCLRHQDKLYFITESQVPGKVSKLLLKKKKRKCHLVMSNSLQPCKLYVAHKAPLLMGFSRQEYWSGQVMSFSRGHSWPKDWTWVSCTTGRFFTIWATREALKLLSVAILFKDWMLTWTRVGPSCYALSTSHSNSVKDIITLF